MQTPINNFTLKFSVKHEIDTEEWLHSRTDTTIRESQSKDRAILHKLRWILPWKSRWSDFIKTRVELVHCSWLAFNVNCMTFLWLGVDSRYLTLVFVVHYLHSINSGRNWLRGVAPATFILNWTNEKHAWSVQWYYPVKWSETKAWVLSITKENNLQGYI